MRTAESVVLTDCPPGPLERYTSIVEVVGVDVDVDLLGLREHGDRRRARVHPALALGGGHALHAVRTGLVLEPRPRVVALHHEGDLPQAVHVGHLAGQHLDLPAVQVGVALVHVEEVGGPEVALLTALAAADLDDDVLAASGSRGTSSSRSFASSSSAEARLLGARSRSRGTRASRRRTRRRASRAPRRGPCPVAAVVAVRLDDRPQLGQPRAPRRPPPAGRRTRRARRAAIPASPVSVSRSASRSNTSTRVRADRSGAPTASGAKPRPTTGSASTPSHSCRAVA